jgi:phytol kinase
MSDSGWTLVWLLVLAAGVGACILARHLGLRTTYARDLLHVGAGVWVLGWPLWHGIAAPALIVCAAAAATAAVPFVARRSRLAAKVRDTFSDGDERWRGLVFYTVSYAVFTLVGLTRGAFAAGAALLALSLGDGLGGAVGRRFGAHRFRVPGGKQKSIEGSATVALAAAAAVLLAAWSAGAEVPVWTAAGLGFGAALAEALAPRGTDNLIVPITVWALAEAFELGGAS